MVRSGWHAVLTGVGILALLINPPLRVNGQEASGQGEGENPPFTSVRFVETNLTMTDSNGVLSYAKTPLVEIISNQTGKTLSLTVTPTVGSPTTGSWTDVASTATLYTPTGQSIVSTVATGSGSSSSGSVALSNFATGSSINWAEPTLAQMEVQVSRPGAARLVAGTYQLAVTLTAVGG